jgi:hypothetical protein
MTAVRSIFMLVAVFLTACTASVSSSPSTTEKIERLSAVQFQTVQISTRADDRGTVEVTLPLREASLLSLSDVGGVELIDSDNHLWVAIPDGDWGIEAGDSNRSSQLRIRIHLPKKGAYTFDKLKLNLSGSTGFVEHKIGTIRLRY